MLHYDAKIEQQMKTLYRSLNEKDRRAYAAVEAAKLGHGGVEYISTLFTCDQKNDSQRTRRYQQSTRVACRTHPKKRGGRNNAIITFPELKSNFQSTLEHHTAGDPMQVDLFWTHLTMIEIVERLASSGTPVCRQVVSNLLKMHNYVKRKAQKSVALGTDPNRNTQFEKIARLKKKFLKSENPVLSMDTKKKELLGNFYRDGKLYTQQVLQTYDHDFPSSSTGKVVPHGLYDLKENTGYMILGTSHDTSEFACDNILKWWQKHGAANYPSATELLLLCDGGGSNSARHYIFKEDLQNLSDQIGIPIRVAHYPPYTSKYNPIEHRLFSQVTRVCQGVVFHTIEIVRNLMQQKTTKTGLNVFVEIEEKVYETGRKYSSDFKTTMRIQFDKLLPKWNYKTIPINN